MKLYYSATSPYVRKVMACAIARGIEGRIQTVETNPHESPPVLLRDNPLSKVPCLVTEDGLALFDSPVICEYLDSVGDEMPLFPPGGSAARWRALRFQAIGDGTMDATVTRRLDQGRPRDAARDIVIARQEAAIARTLDALEADPPTSHLDIGTITVACALGYLDVRFAECRWREGRPKLAHWHEGMAARPELARTGPPAGA